jgi:hypothetical protein
MSNRQKVKKVTPLGTDVHRRPKHIEEALEAQRRDRTPHHGINAYTCPVCHLNTMTIDVDPGVTPMFLGCRRTRGCTGTAVSAGYPELPVPDELLEHLEWEWTTPTEREFRRLSPVMQAHIDAGGLMLVVRSDRASAYAGVTL